MAVRNVIVELRDRGATAGHVIHGAAAAINLAAHATPPLLQGLHIDEGFRPLPMPPHVTGPRAINHLLAMEMAGHARPGASVLAPDAARLWGEHGPTYLVRGTMEDTSPAVVAALAASTAGNEDVVGIYSDIALSTFPVCPGSPALGTDKDVEQLLGVPKLAGKGMDGTGVFVAVVDTGINLAWLNARGKTPSFDASRSFTTLSGTPGSFPKDHGTMCAFDVCIAAPRCTLLDIAIISAIPFQTLLSDAVRAYSHLMGVLRSQIRPGGSQTLVVTNSWGRFPAIPDFPPGHPSNYSDNPNHPFNRIVGTLESLGADILFAAGNCGPACPDQRCNNITNDGIYGANSHPRVLCIGGVDTTGAIAGYSTLGRGHLDDQKPDVCAYTHFSGSGVYPADGGTSAATPVAAGLIAALRTKRPSNPQDPSASPEALRGMVTKTAIDKGPPGFDYTYGWGIVNGPKLADVVGPKAWTTFFSGSLSAGETHGWYTEGWSGSILVDWRVVPKGQAEPIPQLTLVWRALPQPDGSVMYTLDVTNSTSGPIECEVQYAV